MCSRRSGRWVSVARLWFFVAGVVVVGVAVVVVVVVACVVLAGCWFAVLSRHIV